MIDLSGCTIPMSQLWASGSGNRAIPKEDTWIMSFDIIEDSETDDEDLRYEIIDEADIEPDANEDD